MANMANVLQWFWSCFLIFILLCFACFSILSEIKDSQFNKTDKGVDLQKFMAKQNTIRKGFKALSKAPQNTETTKLWQEIWKQIIEYFKPTDQGAI